MLQVSASHVAMLRTFLSLKKATWLAETRSSSLCIQIKYEYTHVHLLVPLFYI